MNTNDSQPGDQPQREPVDIDAIRETVESGEVTKHRAEDQLVELCDEVERLREQQAKLRAFHNKTVGSLIDQMDAMAAELDAAKGGAA